MLKWIGLCLALILSACAQPKTQLPQVNLAEVEAERAMQNTHLYEQDFKSLYAVPPTRRELQQRIANIAVRVGPAAIQLCNELRARPGGDPKRNCVFDVELGSKKVGINAYADGNIVVVGPQLMELVSNDDHLAFILAHEFAHNIMDHHSDMRQNVLAGALLGSLADALVAANGGYSGASYGATGAELGKISYSPEYEREADYVGLYILSRAGFLIDNTPEVWRRMAAINPDGIYTSTTHPSSPERFVAMRKAIQEIHTKQKKNLALLPEMAQTAAQNTTIH